MNVQNEHGYLLGMTPKQFTHQALFSSPSPRLANEEIAIFIVRLDLPADTVNTLSSLLSNSELQRANKFVFERDRRRFIVARAALRELLAIRLDMSPVSIEFTYGRHGKPELSSVCSGSGLRFNLSHSEDIAAVALVRGVDVGIDIEAVRPISDADQIAKRFFSKQECEAYDNLDLHDKPLGFFNCWTRKEAFIKAVGDGLYYPLDAFDVTLAPNVPAQLLRIGNEAGSSCGWILESFVPTPGYVGAVVCRASNDEPLA